VRRDPTEPLAVIRAEPMAALDRDREVLLLDYVEPPVDVDAATEPTTTTSTTAPKPVTPPTQDKPSTPTPVQP
jgi:hypothetical protein